MPRAAVIGAGVSGLVTAYRLASAGFDVEVLERSDSPGGLAASFDADRAHVDRYYHFICPPDSAYLGLIAELGLDEELRWGDGSMAVFHDGALHPFGTPASLLRFAPLAPADRLRFGLGILRALRDDEGGLDAVSAKDWLVAEQGGRAYAEVWRPLLELKFGENADRVSAAWMRARIERVGRSRPHLLGRERLGYLRGGSLTLVDALIRALEAAGGRVRVDTAVESIECTAGGVTGVRAGGVTVPADVVVSTVATPHFLEITPELPGPYADTLRSVAYDAVACWVLLARVPLTDAFWLNVNDPRIPLPGVITFTRLDPMPELGGLHVHYVPLYMRPGDPRMAASADEMLPSLLAALDLVRPAFSAEVVSSHLFRDRYAQPVYDVGFAARTAAARGPRTPVAGLYRTDMAEVYPADRSIVNAIEQAALVARAVGEDTGARS